MNLREARNTLTQRPFANYDQNIPTMGSTKMEVDHMKDGDIAGLALFQEAREIPDTATHGARVVPLARN